ncbi:ATP synthase F1 subunit epsilon [Candidatus Gracilibacteria bacterium]|nr:ATP synthase F1 subunit epsilon [Candidatus Gracilibacteria bacterium]
MKLRILSFSGESFSSDKVISATLMTGIGEITVLPGHAPLLTSIQPSTMYVVFTDDKGNEKRDDFAIGRGVVEIDHDQVKVMADMLVDIDDLDTDAAERAREQAVALMEKYKNSSDKVEMEKYIEAEDQLLRSIAQLKLGDLTK